ncbi:MAG: DUF3021 family protein [Firmicutes bacterium]|nr:DUF3021 family protein [Bacillota bacterium]
MEQRLANRSFVRISNGEIINLKKVKGFDLSFAGTICVSLSNETVTYGFVITLFISVCIGDGCFYPVTLELIDTMGNELSAVILQTVLCGIMGAGFAAASVIWELDSWSLAKQSGIYFLIVSVIMLPVAYIANWMNHSAAGILSYTGIFVAIFIAVWLVQYFIWKMKIKKMNAVVNKEDNL